MIEDERLRRRTRERLAVEAQQHGARRRELRRGAEQLGEPRGHRERAAAGLEAAREVDGGDAGAQRHASEVVPAGTVVESPARRSVAVGPASSLQEGAPQDGGRDDVAPHGGQALSTQEVDGDRDPAGGGAGRPRHPSSVGRGAPRALGRRRRGPPRTAAIRAIASASAAATAPSDGLGVRCNLMSELALPAGRRRPTGNLPRTGVGNPPCVPARSAPPARLNTRVAANTSLWAGHPRGRGARLRRPGAAARRPHGAASRGAAPGRARAPSPPAASPRSTPTRRRAWEAVARGEHVVVTTGTASGKSLAFNLPVLSTVAGDPHARALYLYPTKALAQDQARAHRGAAACRGVRQAIYDGDTPTEARGQIRRTANLILSNPDMLHVGVLPEPRPLGRRAREPRLRRRRRGARLPRRLRLARGERAAPPAPPGARLRRRAALPARLGDDRQPGRAGARAARRRGHRGRRRRRAPAAAHRRPLEPAAARRGARRARVLAGRGGQAARRCSSSGASAPSASPRAARPPSSSTASPPTGSTRRPPPASRRYRAGYTAEQRRDIERRLVGGDLLGVSATDALELGIDIGLLDAVISVGFPGTVASLRQQWGRAGRRGEGLAVLVAGEDALDQYFMREPATLLGRSVEAAILDHANPRVLDGHVRAAAFEGPLDEADADTLGPEALARAAVLPDLRLTPVGYVWAGKEHPAARTAAPRDRHRPVPDRRHRDRLRARPDRAGARLLDRARGRRLPPPRRHLRRAGAGRGGARRGRPPVRRRLVHAGEEGDDDRDRRAAAGGAALRPRPRLRRRSR